jgi:hypothetical protein
MKAFLRFVPATIAMLALVTLLLRIDISEVRTAIVQGNVAAIVPWAAVLALAYMALHANWERLLLSRTPVPPGYWNVWAGKAGTAVLNAIGFALGAGGYVVWIARATGVGLAGATALRAAAVVADLAALSLVALLTIFIAGAAVPGWFVVGALIALGVAVLVVVGLRLLVATVAALPLAMWGTQVLGRALSMCVSIATTSFAALAFGLDIPLATLCALVPLSMLVRVLPANVAGFGAAQVAFVAVFSPYESEARLFAFHILWQLAANVCYVLRGLPFLNRATAGIAQLSSQSPR